MKDLFIVLWKLIPKFIKIAALIIFTEMTFIIMAANPLDRFGLIVAFICMLPFILLVLFMSIIEPNKKIKE